MSSEPPAFLGIVRVVTFGLSTLVRTVLPALTTLQGKHLPLQDPLQMTPSSIATQNSIHLIAHLFPPFKQSTPPCRPRFAACRFWKPRRLQQRRMPANSSQLLMRKGGVVAAAGLRARLSSRTSSVLSHKGVRSLRFLLLPRHLSNIHAHMQSSHDLNGCGALLAC